MPCSCCWSGGFEREMPMASKVRIGIIGCARILNAHLRGYKLLRENGFGDLFELVALCARKEEDAHRFRRRGQGPGPRPAPVDAPGDPLNAPHAYLSDLHPERDAAVLYGLQRGVVARRDRRGDRFDRARQPPQHRHRRDAGGQTRLGGKADGDIGQSRAAHVRSRRRDRARVVHCRKM